MNDAKISTKEFQLNHETCQDCDEILPKFASFAIFLFFRKV